MPIYEYRCKKCGQFEVIQRITENALKRCPTCRGSVTKLISSTSFQLKGSGWYVTDYARKDGKSKDAAAESKAESAESKSESKGEGASASPTSETKETKSKQSEDSKKSESKSSKVDAAAA